MLTRIGLSLSIICCAFSDHLPAADLDVEVAAGKWDRRATDVMMNPFIRGPVAPCNVQTASRNCSGKSNKVKKRR